MAITSEAALLAETVAAIAPTDREAAAAAQAALDAKTKPRGSLGRLEQLACRVAAIRGPATLTPLKAAVVVAAADHGVAAEGVSAYPREVTRQMLLNFAAGGAAINVLAARAGAELVVVDVGVAEPVADERIKQLRFAPGTQNAAEGPAMTRQQALAALDGGIALARQLADAGVRLVALGDMGIGNTTVASAVCAALLPAPPQAVCGRGTGLDDAGVVRKVAVVERMLAINRLDVDDPVAVVAAVGGLEIAFVAGLALGAAAASSVVLLDGFITGAAALAAARLAPLSVEYMIAAHRSPEPGHALVLEALGLAPLLDLGLRLGEGSGAALAVPLIQSALAIVADMATFATAGVTDAGR
jgi:nicotinate-nucleotide--dimethylbenzimidazole phosphoribosyltransferase